jgi:hypothetical protein
METPLTQNAIEASLPTRTYMLRAVWLQEFQGKRQTIP